jgi:hypothetical protein
MRLLHLIRHHSDHDEWLRRQVVEKCQWSLTMAANRHRYSDDGRLTSGEIREALWSVLDMPLEFITDRPLQTGLPSIKETDAAARREVGWVASESDRK